MKLWLGLMLCAAAYGTTLTGSLKLPNGTGANGTLIFVLAQQEALASTGGCGGPAEITPTYQIKITVTNGSLVSPPAIYGNDCLLPQGSFYNIQFLDTNGNTVFTDRWQLSGSSVDIGTIVSAVITGTTQSLGTPGVVYTNPVSNQTIAQPVSTNFNVNTMQVTTSLTLPNGGVCNSSGCGGIFGNVMDLSSVQTATGAKTFNGGLVLPAVAGNSIAMGSLGNFYDRIFSGGDASCSGVTDGWMGIRTDSKAIEICVGGAEYTISGNSGNYVDLTSNQTVGGLKTFSSQVTVSGNNGFVSYNTSGSTASFSNNSANFVARGDGSLEATLIESSIYGSGTAFENLLGSFLVTGNGDTTVHNLTINGSAYAGSTAGVTCSGTPTSSFASINGIVTHC
jgi:hypothetical protein